IRRIALACGLPIHIGMIATYCLSASQAAGLRRRPGLLCYGARGQSLFHAKEFRAMFVRITILLTAAFAAFISIAVPAVPADAEAVPFRAGDRIIFLGDSITQ